MRVFHKTLAAALLCGAVGFALPSYAADYSSGTANSSSTTSPSTTSPSTATNSADKANTAANTGTPAKETKRTVRARKTAVRATADDQHSIVEALNQKSLQAVQAGQAPDFAGVEPASNQQAQTTRAATKTTIRHRTNTKASVKKGA
jgi:hypothetical protein